jgi:mannitol-1-phosphate/altronate dehydrogenase
MEERKMSELLSPEEKERIGLRIMLCKEFIEYYEQKYKRVLEELRAIIQYWESTDKTVERLQSNDDNDSNLLRLIKKSIAEKHLHIQTLESMIDIDKELARRKALAASAPPVASFEAAGRRAGTLNS